VQKRKQHTKRRTITCEKNKQQSEKKRKKGMHVKRRTNASKKEKRIVA